MNRRSITILLLLTAVLFLAGCSSKITDTSGVIRLNITGLANLGATAKYEGWIIVDGVAESIGKFTVNDEGHMSVTTFSVDKDKLDAATGCFISIEPTPDTSVNHSSYIIMEGDFFDASDSTHTPTNTAPLYIGHPGALNNNFASVTGSYILSSPTDSNSLNETSGVWFINRTYGIEQPGLQIPTLSENWVYEAWAVIDGQTLSMGRFTQANLTDANSTYNGAIPPPSFPGEDFITNLPTGISNPVQMSGKTVFITVQPNADFIQAPFFLTVLKASIPTTAAPHLTFTMTNQAGTSSPTGIATR